MAMRFKRGDTFLNTVSLLEMRHLYIMLFVQPSFLARKLSERSVIYV